MTKNGLTILKEKLNKATGSRHNFARHGTQCFNASASATLNYFQYTLMCGNCG